MHRISPAEIPPNAVLIDVRDELEATALPLSGLLERPVVTAPLAELEEGQVPSLPADVPLVVVCASGVQGELAGAYLLAAGAAQVSVLEGGVRALRRAVQTPGHER